MQLSNEQQIVFDKYRNGLNLFVTGPGGTGKSALIKHIYNDAQNRNLNIQVCALTGCASLLLDCNAKTIHSWAGIGLASGTIESILLKIKKSFYLQKNWRTTKILIIDEVSMMSLKIFELLNSIGKMVRKNLKPFGNIQVLMFGDFYQLPPVGHNDEPETIQFCFESDSWNEVFTLQNHIQLIKNYRQNDVIYLNILNQIRTGKIKKNSVTILQEQCNKIVLPECNIKPTRLFPTRNKVDNINSLEMDKLTNDEIIFNIKSVDNLPMTEQERIVRAEFSNDVINKELAYMSNNLRCDETLILKKGSQVMCIVNADLINDLKICNGSQGIITNFSPLGLPIVQFNNGLIMTMERHTWLSEKIPGIGVTQIPLILAWALTIHKSQGSTLDMAEIDVGSSIFECGQTYVALSRVKSLSGLYLSSFDITKIKINKKVQDFYNGLIVLEPEQTNTTKIISLEPVASI